MDARIERLTRPTGSSFVALMKIYREAIPASERKSPNQLAAMLEREDYRFLVARHGDELTGFSIVYLSESLQFALLEYMAVIKASRNRGIGSFIFRATAQRVKEDHGEIPILLEVDSDREQSQDRATRARRLDFYRRLGCRRVLGLDYMLPLKTRKPPPAMELLLFAPAGRPEVRRERLTAWLRAIYVEVYGQKPDDPRIQLMTRHLADPISLA